MKLAAFLIVACISASFAQTEVPGRYPEASTKLLTIKDLRGLDSIDLRIMRNEIFARKGYIFKSPELTGFFKDAPWYKPTSKNVDALVTDLEKKNIEVIQMEEARLRQHSRHDFMKDIRQLPLIQLPYDLEKAPVDVVRWAWNSQDRLGSLIIGLLPDTSQCYAVLWHHETDALHPAAESPDIYSVTTFSKKLKYLGKSKVAVVHDIGRYFNTNICSTTEKPVYRSVINEDWSFVSSLTLTTRCNPKEDPKQMIINLTGRVMHDGGIYAEKDDDPQRRFK